jgi:acetamidase/formamidase
MTTTRLDPTPGTTADVYSRDHEPVLTIGSGDTVVVRSLDASGYLQPQEKPGQQQAQLFASPRGHCLTGPIAVRAAEPGQMLALHLRSLRPDPWGWTVAGAAETPVTSRLGLTDGEPSWLLWDLDADNGVGTESRGFVRPLAPFLGVMGVAPPSRVSTRPSRRAAAPAATSTARTWSPGPPSTCPWPSRKLCCTSATAMPRRVTARWAARRSSAR